METLTAANGTEIAIADLFSNAFNQDNSSLDFSKLPAEIANTLKGLTGKAAANAGLMNNNGIITVTDAAKCTAFITAEAKKIIENDEDFGGERVAKVWFKGSAMNHIEIAPRGEDAYVLVRDIVIRRSRKDRKEIFGIGIRSVTTENKGIKLTLNRNYIAMIVKGDKNATMTEDEILTWASDLKGKWIVLGTTLSVANKTGYYTQVPNELETTALALVADKTTVRRDSNGFYGFIHTQDGVRYNISGTCDDSEADEYQTAYNAHLSAIAKGKEKEMEERGYQKGLASSMSAKLAELSFLLAEKLIDLAEYKVLRANALAGK
jgi:hypothetical protein